MPRDLTRVTYDENGGRVTAIPKGTPKEEMERAKAEGRVDKNDPDYTVEDAKADAERQDEIVNETDDSSAKRADKAENQAPSQ